MSKPRGFTLIELMVTVAIVAIITAIAVPAYTSQMIKSRRTEAKQGLSDIQLAQEKFRGNNASYSDDIDDLYAAAGGGKPVSDHYMFAITAGSATGWTATATPQGAQADDSICGTITLTMNAGIIESPDDPCW